MDDQQSDTEFSELVSKGIEIFGMQQLADDFYVSIGTLARWTNGKNLPHPGMREPIRQWLLSKITQQSP